MKDAEPFTRWDPGLRWDDEGSGGWKAQAVFTPWGPSLRWDDEMGSTVRFMLSAH